MFLKALQLPLLLRAASGFDSPMQETGISRKFRVKTIKIHNNSSSCAVHMRWTGTTIKRNRLRFLSVVTLKRVIRGNRVGSGRDGTGLVGEKLRVNSDTEV